MPEDRSNPPTEYGLESWTKKDGTRGWGPTVALEPRAGDPQPPLNQMFDTPEEATVACWDHRDRVVVDAVRTGLDAFELDVMAWKGQHNREQQAIGIKRAADALDGFDPDACLTTIAHDMRALAEKVRRGDA